MKKINFALSTLLLSLTLFSQSIQAVELENSNKRHSSSGKQNVKSDGIAVGSFYTTTAQAIAPGQAVAFDLTSEKKGVKLLNGGKAAQVEEKGLYSIQFEIDGFAPTGETVLVGVDVDGQTINQDITIASGPGSDRYSTSTVFRLKVGDVVSVVNRDTAHTLQLGSGQDPIDTEPTALAKINLILIK